MFGLGKDPAELNAIDFLKAEHDAVDELFKAFEEAKDDRSGTRKKALVAQICEALTVHATIEEEIFYPAARNASTVESDLVSEAAVEHQSLKDIIGRLERAPLTDPLYDAGVKVLSEYVKHHVREEESELFPQVKRSDLDLDAMGVALRARKSELTARGIGRAKGGRSKVGKSASRKSANGARVAAALAGR
ncbi:MAG TPA: hemerythrin domain-containing protein [Casimicrobiaceae bacterium]|nr:hemerythrin domain-containing protein [Casimicrobiaceae bacterium]